MKLQRITAGVLLAAVAVVVHAGIVKGVPDEFYRQNVFGIGPGLRTCEALE